MLEMNASQSVLITSTTDHAQSALHVINQARAARALPELPQTHPSIQWINTEAESLKIETIRELITSLSYGHATEQYYCLLHAELLTPPAQHALLKSLEEPPTNCTIILVSTAQEHLLETIQSRCQIIIGSNETSAQESHKKTDASAVVSAVEIELQDLRELLQELAQMRYGEVVDRAERYADASAARRMLLSLLNVLDSDRQNSLASHPEITQEPQMLVQAEQVAMHHLNLLSANCNPRLVTEACLFQLKQIFANAVR
jgi:hypothetical protein